MRLKVAPCGLSLAKLRECPRRGMRCQMWSRCEVPRTWPAMRVHMPTVAFGRAAGLMARDLRGPHLRSATPLSLVHGTDHIPPAGEERVSRFDLADVNSRTPMASNGIAMRGRCRTSHDGDVVQTRVRPGTSVGDWCLVRARTSGGTTQCGRPRLAQGVACRDCTLAVARYTEYVSYGVGAPILAESRVYVSFGTSGARMLVVARRLARRLQ